MDEVLSAVMHSAMADRLTYANTLTLEPDLSTRVALAQIEIANLSGALWEILEAHQSDREGRCAHCGRWRRKRKFPCSVWTIAHHHLLMADRLPARRGRITVEHPRTEPISAS
jgi:hypothetical protein